MNTRTAIGLTTAAMLAAGAMPALALDLTVTHFGTGMYGVPFAVAKEKGYFKEGGLDVTGFLTSAGGGTTIRNAMASEILIRRGGAAGSDCRDQAGARYHYCTWRRQQRGRPSLDHPQGRRSHQDRPGPEG